MGKACTARALQHQRTLSGRLPPTSLAKVRYRVFHNRQTLLASEPTPEPGFAKRSANAGRARWLGTAKPPGRGLEAVLTETGSP